MDHLARFRNPILLGLALVLSGCFGPDRPETAVALVTVETLATAQLGCGGDPEARTPNLDRLARRGTQILEVSVPGPSPTTALASYLTGRLPVDHGVFDDGFALAIPTIVEFLPERDIATASFCGSSAADTRCGLLEGFHHNVLDLDGPHARRVGEPWNERSVAPIDSVTNACDVWLERTPARAFAWIHASGVSDVEHVDAGRNDFAFDRAIGRVWRTLLDRPGDATLIIGGTGPGAPLLVATSNAFAPALRPEPVAGTHVADLVRSRFEGLPIAFAADSIPPATPRTVPPALVHARELDRAGDVEEAMEEYARVLEEEPGRLAVRFRWAELAHMAGNEAGAREAAERILEWVPHHVEARVLLARTWAESEPRRARRMLEPILAWHPSHAGALLVSAETAIASGDHPRALRALRRALAGAGSRTELRASIAVGFSQVGFHGEAVATAREAIARGDERPRTRYALAYALEKAERYPECVAEYRELLRGHPDFLPAYRNLGSLMAQDGEVERAILLWESALRYHPDDAGIKANLEEARRALGLKVVEG